MDIENSLPSLHQSDFQRFAFSPPWTVTLREGQALGAGVHDNGFAKLHFS